MVLSFCIYGLPKTMIVYEPPGDLRLPRGSRIRKRELTAFVGAVAAEIALQGEVSVLLTGDAHIRELNRRFRKKDKATDVLSFPPAEQGSDGARTAVAGDLALSIETALRQSADAGHDLETELKILLLHGLLHLAGYDHETDDGSMRRREEQMRARFSLPAGLIARSGMRRPPAQAKAAPLPVGSKSGAAVMRKRTRADVEGKSR